MSFGEKLTKLRKEKGFSQEDLANHLNVSRQAVSKWESNNSYPETEKIVAICKLFNCSMDELIGLKEGKIKKENKAFNVFNEYFELFLKGIKMFYSMTFKQKLKCIIEMCFYAFILLLCFLISINLLSEIIRKLLCLLPSELLIMLIQIFEGVYYLLYLLFSLYVLVKLYKSRYLDYYDDYLESKEIINEEKKDDKQKINIKEEKIIIRDADNDFKPFLWFKNISIIIMKIISSFISLGLAIVLVSLIAIVIFLIYFLKSGIILLYISIGLLGGLIGIYIILEILIKFIFNMKQNSKKLFIMFIIAMFVVGIGCGLFACELSKYKIIDNVEFNALLYSESIPMRDNLIIEYIDYYDTDIVFDNRNDILIEFYGYDKDIANIVTHTNTISFYDNKVYELRDFHIEHFYEDKSINEIISETLVSVEDKKIILNDLLYRVKIKIYISENNYNKLLSNKHIEEQLYNYYE